MHLLYCLPKDLPQSALLPHGQGAVVTVGAGAIPVSWHGFRVE